MEDNPWAGLATLRKSQRLRRCTLCILVRGGENMTTNNEDGEDKANEGEDIDKNEGNKR